jgi:hypothetical protein
MQLSTLIVITLRLFAVYYLFEGISTLATTMPMLLSFEMQLGSTFFYQYTIMVVVLFLLSAGLWALSAQLSTRISRGHDIEIAFTLLTRGDLYRFAFVFLGLFFALSSLEPLIHAGYQFFAFDFSLPADSPQKGKYLWPFLSKILPMAGGLMCLFGAGIWTKKLIRMDAKTEA